MPKDSLYEDFSATVERKCEDHGQRERERSEGDTEKEQRLGYLSPCLHPISASCRGRNGEALE